MAALDQILAILRGRKVYDSAGGLWRVYDDLGVELADTSGILLRGLHGFMLRQFVSLLKYWNGSEWIQKPLKRWNGTAWATVVINRWNGSSWV